MVNFVKCICNYRREKELSINKVYEVVEVTPLCYKIIDNKFNIIACTKDRFVVVENNKKTKDTSKSVKYRLDFDLSLN